MEDSVELRGYLFGHKFGVFGDQNGAAACSLGAGEEILQFETQTGGEQDDRAAQAVDGDEELRHVLTLGNDPHVFLERQCSGRACAEDRLVISENNSVHKCRGLLPAANDAIALAIPLSVDCNGDEAMSTIRTTFGFRSNFCGRNRAWAAITF